MKVVYCRCVDGHYFVGPACPLDGWTSDPSRELDHAFSLLREDQYPASIEALRARGCDESAIERAVVVEFGDPTAIYDAIEPAALVIDGTWLPLRDVRRWFK